nr:MAG TPA: hypothetical protein [Caudoviricetes sp.]
MSSSKPSVPRNRTIASAAAVRMVPVTALVSSSVRSAGLVEAGMASTAVTTQPGNR